MWTAEKNFKNLNLSDLLLWSGKKRNGAIILCGVLVFMVLFFIFNVSAFQALSEAKQQEQDLKQQLIFIIPQQLLQQRDIKALEQIKQTTIHHNKWVPTVEKLAYVLDTLTQWAASNQLNLDLLKPNAPKQEEFYAYIPIEVQMEGTYKSMVHFMDQVAQWDYYLYPQSVNITPYNADSENAVQGTKKAAAPSGVLRLKMTLAMYYFSPRPEVPAK